jgi:ammonia channel protein AmtB
MSALATVGAVVRIDSGDTAWMLAATALVLMMTPALGLFYAGLRASEHQEAIGMDVTQHGEEAYVTGEGAILITPEAGLEAETLVADPS